MSTIRFSFAVVLLLAALSAAAAVQVGDSYEKVIAEKGKPPSRMEAGAIQILSYPDLSVRLKDGVVVEVTVPRRISEVHVPEGRKPPPKKIAAAPAGAAWTTDLRGALVQAKEQNRRVFLFFTGSDWCVWCHRLKDEILSTPDFARYAADNLILVELDFPKHLVQPEDLKAQNMALARHYRITGYPTVIVIDAEGKTLARLGYQKGGPGPFVEALGKL